MATYKILLGIIIITLSLIPGGCVEIPSQGQLPPDYRSQVRIIDVASDTSGTVTLTIDGASVADLFFGLFTGYLDIPSGGRMFSFGGGTAQKLVFGSNRQHSVLVIPLTSGNRFVNLDEGYSFSSNSKPGVAQVRFIHVAQGSAPTIAFADSGVTILSRLYAENPPYTDLIPGDHLFNAISATDTTPGMAVALVAGRNYTVIATGADSTFQIFMLPDRQAGLSKIMLNAGLPKKITEVVKTDK